MRTTLFLMKTKVLDGNKVPQEGSELWLVVQKHADELYWTSDHELIIIPDEEHEVLEKIPLYIEQFSLGPPPSEVKQFVYFYYLRDMEHELYVPCYSVSFTPVETKIVAHFDISHVKE